MTSSAEKIFFLLYALKNNSLQKSLVASLAFKQELAHPWFDLLESLLKKALKDFTPRRSPLKVNEPLQTTQPYLLDATQRPIPPDTYQQEEF